MQVWKTLQNIFRILFWAMLAAEVKTCYILGFTIYMFAMAASILE
jgi:hypothetical protein